ncbi:MAG: hypothetical protein HY608_00065, partial [Planctomycetes bacterium]|nr:hypothetical protein [Planctomycetota bacterium]
LGKVGGPIRATRHDGHCIEGILQRADPFGLLIETPAGTERVGFHDLSDATLAEIASATTFERGVLALRSGDLDGATVRFHACRDVRTRARCEEITRLAQAGSTPPR